MAETLAADRPDIVHVHNLYPLFSPSVLVACRRAGVPVVMTTHNYTLTCPVTSHLHKGRVCEKCFGGREHWCVLKNCRGNLAESLAYALRSFTARKLRFFHDDVAIQIALSNFAKQRLVKAGFDEERIAVLPDVAPMGPELDGPPAGNYVAFSGRMMAEKGVDVLLAAAARLPQVPLRLAGDGSLLAELRGAAPANASFLNRLGPIELVSFYRGARFLVVPSKWFEGCPLVITEAMSHGRPSLLPGSGPCPRSLRTASPACCSRRATFDDLVGKIRLLWDSPDLCRRLGEAGRKKARGEYGEESYYRRLMAIYDKAIEMHGRRGLSRRKNTNPRQPAENNDERHAPQSAIAQ